MHDLCKISSSASVNFLALHDQALISLLMYNLLLWCVRSFTHHLPALRKLDLVMRLILWLRLPGKARLGSELESGTGHFSLCNFDTRKIRKGSLRLHDIRMIYATPRFFCCLTSVAPAPARPKYTCSLYNHVLHSP